MQYYSEDAMRELRALFELEVMNWPKVTRRSMFGCPSYQADGRLFAFLVTDGIVITQLLKPDREALARRQTVTEFKAGERVLKYWVQVEVSDRRTLSYIIPYIRKSYEAALARGEGKEISV